MSTKGTSLSHRGNPFKSRTKVAHNLAGQGGTRVTVKEPVFETVTEGGRGTTIRQRVSGEAPTSAGERKPGETLVQVLSGPKGQVVAQKIARPGKPDEVLFEAPTTEPPPAETAYEKPDPEEAKAFVGQLSDEEKQVLLQSLLGETPEAAQPKSDEKDP